MRKFIRKPKDPTSRKEGSNRFSLRLMCDMLSVSVSGYYAWLNRKPSSRKQSDHELSKKIKVIFDDEKGRAGARGSPND